MLPGYNEFFGVDRMDLLDNLAKRLQAQCDAEVVKRFGIEVMAQWQDMQGFGLLSGADCQGMAERYGIFVTVYLQFTVCRVAGASFDTNGCGTLAVCASVATKLAIGRTTIELLALTAEDFFGIIPGLQQKKAHYVCMALEALRAAARSCPSFLRDGTVAVDTTANCSVAEALY